MWATAAPLFWLPLPTRYQRFMTVPAKGAWQMREKSNSVVYCAFVFIYFVYFVYGWHRHVGELCSLPSPPHHITHRCPPARLSGLFIAVTFRK